MKKKRKGIIGQSQSLPQRESSYEDKLNTIKSIQKDLLDNRESVNKGWVIVNRESGLWFLEAITGGEYNEGHLKLKSYLENMSDNESLLIEDW